MPQGRKKAPFSGKAKKQQMQAKKQRQQSLLGKIINNSYNFFLPTHVLNYYFLFLLF